MKITLVCDILGKEDNGTTIATMNFVRHLKKQHHKIRILCCDPTKRGMPGYYVTNTKKFFPPISNFVKSTGFALAKPDRRIVEEAIIGADVVHCLEPFALSHAAIKVAKQFNIPVTAAVHLLPEHITNYLYLSHVPLSNFSIYKYWWNHIYKFTKAIHYPTQFTYDIFKENNPGAEKIAPYIISNGINKIVKPKKVKKPLKWSKKIVILCCGRYSPEKSQKTLINAVKASKYINKIQLIFAGQGQKEKYYKKLSLDLPVKPIFKRYEHKKLVDIINYCDFVVHPAYLETEGLAVLEALACGKLVIVSDAKKAAPNRFGITSNCIFPAKNEEALTRLIDYWIEHPQEKPKVEKHNLLLSNKYDQHICLLKLEQMLIDVVAEKNRG